jgi:hypothetical protein
MTGRDGMRIVRPWRNDSRPRAAIGAALTTTCLGVRVRVGVPCCLVGVGVGVGVAVPGVGLPPPGF